MKQFYFLVNLLVCFSLYAQSEPEVIDKQYLEDQFYLSLVYNVVKDKPENMSQNGFSGGVTMGFIRDFPINEQRTFGLGLGIGYGFNVLVHNLKLEEVNNNFQYSIAQGYDVNRWTFNSVEVPFEIRWRNSTPTRYRFWRVYTGVKFIYVFASKTKYRDANSEVVLKNINGLNKLQYGLQFSAGYGNWNLFVYYGLKSILKNASMNGTNVKIKNLSVGIKFYMM